MAGPAAPNGAAQSRMLRIVGAVGFYFLCSITLVFANKALTRPDNAFNGALFVTLMQLLMASLLVFGIAKCVRTAQRWRRSSGGCCRELACARQWRPSGAGAAASRPG